MNIPAAVPSFRVGDDDFRVGDGALGAVVPDADTVEAATWIGLPQFGHAAALSLTSVPHSSHFISAIISPGLVFVAGAILPVASAFG